MSNITASDVNKLRKSTGAGIMDCKKALVEANGDFDLAIENLRKKGQKVAAKRADRDSSEGAVIAKVNDANDTGIIISLNCETDFVAKNESFVALANEIATIALSANTKDELLSSDFENMTVQEKLIEQTGVIGEKLEIGSFERISSEFVGSYIHAGNKIATIVGLSNSFDGASEVAKNVSMQAAAMNPVALDESGVSKDIIEKEIDTESFKINQSERKKYRKYEDLTEPKLIKEISKLEKSMQKFSKNLEFEKAAEIRDEIKFLKIKVYGPNLKDHMS